ncbi:MAG: carboxypeptidase regulatory-like domain-containing protein, partial [Candidatus Cloacimonetes bacterium]|nr:carboxypeptidase regulatory-like domain-containing protein [Candidatus Cloacimonadota bacterium]
MKKIITFLFIIIVGILFANPIEAEYFSEIYFEGDEWQIELAYTELFGEWGFDNLDNHRLVTNYGISNFRSGIDLTNISVIVINQDSLLTFLYIDNTSDDVRLEQFIDNEWIVIDHAIWGSYQPFILYEGQSLIKMYFYDWGYIRVKDNEPTLGYEPFYSNARGTLSGRVFDSDNNPICGAEISIIPSFSPDVYTDETGYFEMVDMITMVYQQLYISYNEFSLEPQGEYYVEPDSTTYYEYILDISNTTNNQYELKNLITISNF